MLILIVTFDNLILKEKINMDSVSKIMVLEEKVKNLESNKKLRNNLGEPLRKFGKIGFSVPSEKRPKAGLDYRYSLIINDERYIEKQDEKKLPNAQYRIIEENIELIKREINEYVNKYVKVAKKNRHKIEPLFRVSSLVNFHKELEIDDEQTT